jgi:hypothetical protein
MYQTPKHDDLRSPLSPDPHYHSDRQVVKGYDRLTQEIAHLAPWTHPFLTICIFYVLSSLQRSGWLPVRGGCHYSIGMEHYKREGTQRTIFYPWASQIIFEICRILWIEQQLPGCLRRPIAATPQQRGLINFCRQN